MTDTPDPTALREAVLETMRIGNSSAGLSGGDKGEQELRERCEAENEAELDAYRATLLAEVVEAIEGEREKWKPSVIIRKAMDDLLARVRALGTP